MHWVGIARASCVVQRDVDVGSSLTPIASFRERDRLGTSRWWRPISKSCRVDGGPGIAGRRNAGKEKDAERGACKLHAWNLRTLSGMEERRWEKSEPIR